MNNVSFPGFGLEFDIRRYAFTVFNVEIYWYGIIIAFAFLLAVLLGIRSCRKYDLEPDNILDLVLFAAPTAIVFARLFYVVFSWDQNKDQGRGTGDLWRRDRSLAGCMDLCKKEKDHLLASGRLWHTVSGAWSGYRPLGQFLQSRGLWHPHHTSVANERHLDQ